jgi:hypothetical protein
VGNGWLAQTPGVWRRRVRAATRLFADPRRTRTLCLAADRGHPKRCASPPGANGRNADMAESAMSAPSAEKELGEETVPGTVILTLERGATQEREAPYGNSSFPYLEVVHRPREVKGRETSPCESCYGKGVRPRRVRQTLSNLEARPCGARCPAAGKKGAPRSCRRHVGFRVPGKLAGGAPGAANPQQRAGWRIRPSGLRAEGAKVTINPGAKMRKRYQAPLSRLPHIADIQKLRASPPFLSISRFL